MIPAPIQDYIDLVRSGSPLVCADIVRMVDIVDLEFEAGNVWVDMDLYDRYMRLEKYMPFRLFPWEKFLFCIQFCTFQSGTDKLRWPDVMIYVGRGAGKNGYASFAAFAAISPINPVRQYHVDVCANSEDQAKTSFEDVWQVLEDNQKQLSKHFSWTKEQIIGLKNGSRFRFRTSSAKSADGGRPGMVIFDEVHAYVDYRQIKVFKTGFGKKANPRMLIISTDGDVRGGPLDDYLDRSHRILAGDEDDYGLLPYLCHIESEQEVSVEACWYKANPSLQYLPDLLDEIRKEFAEYRSNPYANADFSTKRMNFPVGNREADVTSWDNILATNRPLPDIDGRPCVFGIDFAKTSDFVAAGLLFWDPASCEYAWVTHTWVCLESPDLPRIKAPLREWEARGLITFVAGPEIAPECPMQWIARMESEHHLRIIGGALDNYRYQLMARAIEEAGYSADKHTGTVKCLRQADIAMIAPLWMSAFARHAIIWGDNPLMRWATNNMMQTTSKMGNVIFSKKEPKSRKTDPASAFLAAFCISDKLEKAERINNITVDTSPIIIG